MQKNIVSHIGTIVNVSSNKVSASFEVSEACGNCQAKTLCEKGKGKLITIEADKQLKEEYQIGERVNVCLSSKLATSSVLLAYVLPLVLLFLVMIMVIIISGNDDIGCLSGLAILPIYYFFLYLFREKLNNKFKFTITKIDN
ncbi:MAG: SoxR reducing system RseC family protein [Bacteroidales bacterium]|nr:SoxR reducing system RseC family protein [Bacteroidales bacterium]